MPDDDIPGFMLPVAGFEARKAAQVVAYLATKEGNYGIEKLKLIKLLYLSERRFIEEHGMPMFYDELYSLPHGPICSSALNGIDQKIQCDVWLPYVALHGNVAYPSKRMKRADLDEVSDAEIAVVDAIWAYFRKFSASAIRNWTHRHCPEYVEVGPGARCPIEYPVLLKALGFTRDEAEEVERAVSATRRAASLLAA